jgi:hypothetical protein
MDALLHVGGEVKFEGGAILGELSEKSSNNCFGLVDGRAGFKHSNGFMVFGTGHGNIKGKGTKGSLAIFDGAESIKESHISFTDAGALYSPAFLTKNLQTDSIKLGDVILVSKEDFIYANDKKLAYHFKRGNLKCDFGEIEGEGKFVGGDISIKATKASKDFQGIVSFNEDFNVNNGHAAIAWKKAPRASMDSNGVLYAADYNYFANKAASFDVGDFTNGEGIIIKGGGKTFGAGVIISSQIADNSKRGIASFLITDFSVKDGVVSLQNPPPSPQELTKIFNSKQDVIQTAQLTCGDGFYTDYKFNVLAGEPINLQLAKATSEKFGIARFSRDDFTVSEGNVCLNKTPIATGERNGLMASEYVRLIAQLAEGFAKCPQGNGSEGTLALWSKNGELSTATDFVNNNFGLSYKKLFEAANFRTPGVLILGTTEANAEKIGGGALRYEKGCLEVSNGQQWVTLRAGGLTGTGLQGSLAYWNDENSLSAPKELFWDETLNSLGLGTDKPLAHIHIERAGAAIIISDTRPSSPQSGAALLLAANDGADLGASDCLGKIGFGGKNAIGASIRAFAAANWDKISTPTSLAFGTTPDGQISPVEHLFITTGGFIGVDIASPLAPLHVHAQNKNGMAGIFDGGIKIGSSDASASIVGKGSLKFESGRLLVSDGYAWRTLTMEA